MASPEIREERLTWLSKGYSPECEELFFYFPISLLLHAESEDDRVYFWCRVEARPPDIAHDIDISAGEFHSEREIGVVGFFRTSFEDFFPDFFLHHDGHFCWWIPCLYFSGLKSTKSSRWVNKLTPPLLPLIFSLFSSPFRQCRPLGLPISLSVIIFC